MKAPWIGLLVLGDRAKHGYVPVTIAGFLVSVSAVLLLALHRPELAKPANVH